MVLFHTKNSSLFNAIIIRMIGTVGHVSDDRVSIICAPGTNLTFVESLSATNTFIEDFCHRKSDSNVM